MLAIRLETMSWRIHELLTKIAFRLRHPRWLAAFRVSRLRILGLKAGSCNYAGPGFFVSWPQMVSIGSNCVFEGGVLFKIDHHYSRDTLLEIGNHVFIGTGTELNITNKVTIGSGTLIASGCRIIDHDHGIRSDRLIRDQPSTSAEIRIGVDCWIGANAVILKGVSIGDHAVVAAGAVVTQSIPPYDVWAGVPAKHLKSRDCFQSLV
jgi:acetyltransferase-like isoleucine patch superfamily enzyme